MLEIVAVVLIFSPVGLLVIGGVLYYILKRRYQKEIYIAAIQQGVSVPELPQETSADPRKTALVLIALGIGFSIATYFTLSFITDADAPNPLQVSIWGIMPVLIGIALLVHRKLAEGGHAEGG